MDVGGSSKEGSEAYSSAYLLWILCRRLCEIVVEMDGYGFKMYISYRDLPTEI